MLRFGSKVTSLNQSQTGQEQQQQLSNKHKGLPNVYSRKQETMAKSLSKLLHFCSSCVYIRFWSSCLSFSSTPAKLLFLGLCMLMSGWSSLGYWRGSITRWCCLSEGVRCKKNQKSSDPRLHHCSSASKVICYKKITILPLFETQFIINWSSLSTLFC